jgi:hypothetical protein
MLNKSYGYHGTAREVALYVPGDDGRLVYVTRGAWYEARPVARSGFRAFRGGAVSVPADQCRFVLDRAAYGDPENNPEADRKDLCWGGPSMSATEFLQWCQDAPDSADDW